MLASSKSSNKGLMLRRLNKTIDLVAWSFVFFTTCALIMTIVSTYHYFGLTIKYFEGYTTFQRSLLITMALGAFSLFDKKEKGRSILIAIGCLAIAAGALYFIYINVF